LAADLTFFRKRGNDYVSRRISTGRTDDVTAALRSMAAIVFPKGREITLIISIDLGRLYFVDNEQ